MNKYLKNFFLYMIIGLLLMVSCVTARVYWSEGGIAYLNDNTLNFSNVILYNVSGQYNITDMCASENGEYIFLLLQKNSTYNWILPIQWLDGNTYTEKAAHLIQTTVLKKSLGCSDDGSKVWYNNLMFSNDYGNTFNSRAGTSQYYNCNENASLCLGTKTGYAYVRQFISTNQGINWKDVGGVNTYTYQPTSAKPCVTGETGVGLANDFTAGDSFYYNGTSSKYLVAPINHLYISTTDIICGNNTFIYYNDVSAVKQVFQQNNSSYTHTHITALMNGIAGNNDLSSVYFYNSTGLFKLNNETNFTLIKYSSDIMSVAVTFDNFTATTTTVVNTSITQNFTTIGLVNFANQQCMQPSNDGTNYLCNNTLFIGNEFYCDSLNAQPCPSGTECFEHIFDENTSSHYIYNPYNSCTNVEVTSPTLRFKCSPISIQSSSKILLNIFNTLNINCSITTNDYVITTKTYCNDLPIWDYAQLYYTHNLTTWGECQSVGCTNFCNVGEYSCGGLSTSKVCTLQSNGCYDWNLSTTCTGGYVCKQATGLCGLITTDNTCTKDADCVIGQECLNGGCSTCTDCGNSEEDTNGLFGSLSTSTKYWIMLIASIFAVITMTVIMASFGDGMAGLLVGLVLSMLTSLVLTLLFRLSLLIPILYIIIGGAIVAILVRRTFVGQ